MRKRGWQSDKLNMIANSFERYNEMLACLERTSLGHPRAAEEMVRCQRLLTESAARLKHAWNLVSSVATKSTKEWTCPMRHQIGASLSQVSFYQRFVSGAYLCARRLSHQLGRCHNALRWGIGVLELGLIVTVRDHQCVPSPQK